MTERNVLTHKLLLFSLVITMVVTFLLCSTAGAGRTKRSAGATGTKTTEATANPKNLERWRSLSPEEKGKIIERYRKWKRLPTGKRKRIIKRYRKFKKLAPEKRRRLKKRWLMMKKLSYEERAKLRSSIAKFRSFSPAKKRVISENMGVLRILPPGERLEGFMGMEVLGDFTGEEKRVLYKYFFEIKK